MTPDTRLLALHYTERGAGDLMLAGIVAALRAEGARLAGLMQVNAPGPADSPCDMDVVVLGEAAAPTRISEARGAEARGCRLDAGALQQVAHRVEATVRPGIDLLVLSKFGRQEAEGGGLRQAIALALEHGIPVLTGVRADYRAAFEAFAGELGTVTDDEATALRWARSHLAVTSP